MKRIFAPGCGLKLYKEEASDRIFDYLKKVGLVEREHDICCHHEPQLEVGTQIINVCSGCDKRFSNLYEGITTITLWEILAERDDFPFPDYNGMEMTIHDACPTRNKTYVHEAIRLLIKRMNISIVEPEQTGIHSICCGDSLHREVSNEKVYEFMNKRADSMPCENVIVYCTSCTKAMANGGKKPRYLIDLLLGQETIIGDTNPDTWHDQLDKYIEQH